MKIAIDAGHGISTPGKRCAKQFDTNETREWTLNSRVATKVVNILNQYDVSVIRLDDTTGKTDIGLNDRVRNANNNNVDLVVSIHHNAGGGTGTETYVYNTACLNGKAGKLAKLVQAKAVEKTGFKSRGVKTGNFAIIRDTKAPACLIECGFMDNASDTPIILTEDFANKVANGIAEGIIEYASLTKKVTKVSIPYPGTLIKKGSKGDNVRKVQARLIELGYSCGKYGADGIFGNDTLNAVKSYQKSNGLAVDGIVGKNTWGKLFN